MNKCECGCGEPVRRRFVSGHNARPNAPAWARVLERCKRVGDCLVWQGVASNGYGLICVDGRQHNIHRVVYEHFHGPIPEGFQVDHVKARGCRFTLCCEPSHLEAVTPRENILRSSNWAATNLDKTHCKHGHELTPENIYRRPNGSRQCKECVRLSGLRQSAGGYWRQLRRRKKDHNYSRMR